MLTLRFTMILTTTSYPVEKPVSGQIGSVKNQAKGCLTIRALGKRWTLRFPALSSISDDIQISINGEPISDFEVSVIQDIASAPVLQVVLPRNTIENATVTVALGKNPQLSVLGHTNRMASLVRDFQTGNNFKNHLWNIISSSKPVVVKMAALISSDIDKQALGLLEELLLADSRSPIGGCYESTSSGEG